MCVSLGKNIVAQPTRFLMLLMLMVLSACGKDFGPTSSGSTSIYSVGGTFTGLMNGTQLTLLDKGTDALQVSGSGGFQFTTKLPTGSTYVVTVGVQPSGEICTVTNGSGTVGVTNTINIQVACSANPAVTYTVGGTLSGLSGSLVLQDNGVDALTLTQNGPFTFTTALVNQAAYTVSVATQPAGQTCGVTHGSGTVQAAKVVSITVSCVENPLTTFSIGGSINGLSGSVTLLESISNSSETFTGNGSFALSNALPSGSHYNLTVSLQPAGQTCTVTNGSGIIGTANVTNITLSCDPAYSIGGMITGLWAGEAVELKDNGSDTLTVLANGSFTFPTQLAGGATYEVTFTSAQQVAQTCTVTNGSGTVGSADVTSVQVSCATLEKVLYSFGPSPDGLGPESGVIQDAAGNLYGTTYQGGVNANGTVFAIDPSTGTETFLYSFGPTPDGHNPEASLIQDAAGNLYGSTLYGGASGDGTLFELNPTTGAESFLYSFGGTATDAQSPDGCLIQDAAGNLYGATYAGGPNGYGTVFRLNPTTGTESVLHSFGSTATDGQYANGCLIQDAAGNLYGTTYAGGTSGNGTVFKLDPSTGTETILYSFGTGTDGQGPSAGLFLDAAGNLYGTTYAGGTSGNGTVFEIY